MHQTAEPVLVTTPASCSAASEPARFAAAAVEAHGDIHRSGLALITFAHLNEGYQVRIRRVIAYFSQFRVQRGLIEVQQQTAAVGSCQTLPSLPQLERRLRCWDLKATCLAAASLPIAAAVLLARSSSQDSYLQAYHPYLPAPPSLSEPNAAAAGARVAAAFAEDSCFAAAPTWPLHLLPPYSGSDSSSPAVGRQHLGTCFHRLLARPTAELEQADVAVALGSRLMHLERSAGGTAWATSRSASPCYASACPAYQRLAADVD